MNSRVLESIDAWRVCAICEAIAATRAAVPAPARVTRLGDLPVDPHLAMTVLEGSEAVDFQVVRFIGRDSDRIRNIEVEAGAASTDSIRALIRIARHDAAGVRFTMG